MGQYTSKFSLYKPAVGETGWGSVVDSNWDIIDANLGGGVGSVSKVFGRTGTVVATIGDYSFPQISGTITITQLASTEGTGSKIQLTNTGVTTSGDIVTYDSSGNVQDSGVLLSSLAPLNSPAFIGTPTATTPSTADASTKIATTAWVNAQGYGTATGNVTGPASSINNDIVIFNGINGKAIQDSGITVSSLAPLSSPTFTGSPAFNGNVAFNNQIIDHSSSAGLSGQLLSSTSTGIQWVTLADSISSVSTTQALSFSGLNLTVKATAGAGGITITLMTAIGNTGRKVTVKRVDSGAGTIIIATTAAQTIDGVSTYSLIDIQQYIVLESDGSNWMIVSNN